MMPAICYKRGVVVCHNDTTDAIEDAFIFGTRMVMGEHFMPRVTSGIDGNHSLDPESGHYQARALDLGLWGYVWSYGDKKRQEIPENAWEEVVAYIQQRLDDQSEKGRYFVVLERNPNHIHAQRNKNTF